MASGGWIDFLPGGVVHFRPVDGSSGKKEDPPSCPGHPPSVATLAEPFCGLDPPPFGRFVDGSVPPEAPVVPNLRRYRDPYRERERTTPPATHHAPHPANLLSKDLGRPSCCLSLSLSRFPRASRASPRRLVGTETPQTVAAVASRSPQSRRVAVCPRGQAAEGEADVRSRVDGADRARETRSSVPARRRKFLFVGAGMTGGGSTGREVRLRDVYRCFEGGI